MQNLRPREFEDGVEVSTAPRDTVVVKVSLWWRSRPSQRPLPWKIDKKQVKINEEEELMCNQDAKLNSELYKPESLNRG
jgi:hypothetical protein